jgi:hypothetical protein
VRATAVGFCFHQGAIWGGLIAPLLAYYASSRDIPLSGPILVTTVVGLAVFVVAVLLSPETKGKVIADIDREAAEIVLIVHWIGGVHSEMRLPRRRRGQRNSTSVDVIAAVRQLVLIANDDLIAGILNRNGLVRQWQSLDARTGHVTALTSSHPGA